MSEAVNVGPVESIRTTLDMYAPHASPILVGAAAVHWALYARDCDSAVIPLKDVDVLVSGSAVEAVQASLQQDMVDEVVRDNHRLTIQPSREARALGATTLDAFSDNDYYDDPLIFTKHSTRVYRLQFDVYKNTLVREYEGIRYAKLPFIFWWKASTGRDSDMSTLERALKILNDNDKFEATEPLSLFKAMESGMSGDGFENIFPTKL